MLARPMDLDALLAEPLDGRFRAFPDTAGRVTLADAGAQGWNVARGDLPFPVLTIDDGAIEHNLRTMHRWCGERASRSRPTARPRWRRCCSGASSPPAPGG